MTIFCLDLLNIFVSDVDSKVGNVESKGYIYTEIMATKRSY